MSELPILTFHSLDSSGSVISFAPAAFRRTMQELAAAGWVGTDLARASAPEAAGTNARRFALTFDDGYRNLLAHALPCLRELHFTATVFVVADRIGGDNRWSGQAGNIPTLDLLDRSELARLVDAGWEIGSHGLTHRPLPSCDSGPLEREFRESQLRLEEELVVPVRSFAYPYGAHDAAVRATTRRHYDRAVGTRLAVARTRDLGRPFQLPRIDSYYLAGWEPDRLLRGPVGRAYLAARRLGRRVRRANE